jgi:Na+/H+ antiporter NhaC
LKAVDHRKVLGAAAFAAVCIAAAWFGRASHAQLQAPWYSVVPPLLAITLAFVTRNVLLSLGAAVAAGGLLISVPPAPASLDAWTAAMGQTLSLVLTTATDRRSLLTLSFVAPIFAMVELVIAAGGFQGVVAWLMRRVRSGRSAQLATAAIGTLCFIDDYASSIIVGSMMQPITDRFRVSRAKLAFLVDATSAPVSGLAIVSTWIVVETSLFAGVSEQLGLGKSGYAIFFDALSFRFYCLLMLAFMYVHIIAGRDFGPMRKAEEQARNGTPVNGNPAGTALDRPGQPIVALLPLLGLVAFHLTGLWLDGRGPGKLAGPASLVSPAYWRDVIGAAQHSQQILVCAALFGTTVAILCGGLAGTLRPSAVFRCLYRGLRRAILPCVILVLAWSLKNTCQSLGTGQFLAGLLADRIPSYCFPPLVFVIGCVVSFATGTSYGTMAILIPTAIPIAYALDGNTYGLTTIISCGAILDGAIFGDHCSPISDTTILSATASSCDLILHTRTQLPYSLFVAAVALACAYVPSALGLHPLWSLALATLVMAAALLLAKRPHFAAQPVRPQSVPKHNGARAGSTGAGP